jgi:hypothetical protein
MVRRVRCALTQEVSECVNVSIIPRFDDMHAFQQVHGNLHCIGEGRVRFDERSLSYAARQRQDFYSLPCHGPLWAKRDAVTIPCVVGVFTGPQKR